MPSVKKEFRRAERKRLGDADTDDEDDESIKQEKLVIKRVKTSYSDEEESEEFRRTPTPPNSLEWPTAQNSWFEDSRGKRREDFNLDGPDYMRREHRLDDDPYYNGAGSSNGRNNFSQQGPNRGYRNRRPYY